MHLLKEKAKFMESMASYLKDHGNILIPIIMFSVIGLIAIVAFYFSDKKIIIRAFKKSRKKSINSVKNNEYVKIIGKAKHVGDSLIAPLSGRPCVYYHVIVEAKTNKNWKNIIDDEKLQDFFIESNSELALIKTNDLENKMRRFYMVKDFKKSSGFNNDTTEKLESYLRLHNKKSIGFLGFNKTMRYTESIIALNEPIGLKGLAKWKSINTPIDGYSYSKILTLTGTKKQKLLLTDEPKALRTWL